LDKINKALLGGITGGVLGFFLATVGFWRTLLILFLIILGWLIGSYFEAKKS